MPERNRLSAEIAKRPVLTSFHDYDDAQRAVDKLSDAQFPVQPVPALDLKMWFENVLRRGRRGCHPCYFLPNGYLDENV